MYNKLNNKEVNDVKLGDIIKSYRNENKVTMQDIADKSGLSKGYISMIENGKNPRSGKPISPNITSLSKLAQGMNMDLEYLIQLLGDDQKISLIDSQDEFPHPRITDDYVTFPVIGDAAAGFDHIAIENWSGETVDIPYAHLHGRPASDYIVLNVHGDSMYPFYLDGDKVLVLLTPTLSHSGQIGVIRYDGEMATLKKVEYVDGEDWMRLIPINPEFKPKTITGSDLEMCEVIGIPTLLIREIEQ